MGKKEHVEEWNAARDRETGEESLYESSIIE